MAKTLKIKKAEPTISAKPVVSASAEGGAAPAGEAAPAQPSGGIYVSSRHKIENAGVGAAAARPERFGWAAVLAVIATVLFVCVLIMEFADWSALKFA
ncbi:MAG: hypothetical protein IJV65_02205 [Kiritimatiellae bacterium]|nr:hypothetical protein [Kiritimatiellia bacterium]